MWNTERKRKKLLSVQEVVEGAREREKKKEGRKSDFWATQTARKSSTSTEIPIQHSSYTRSGIVARKRREEKTL